MRNDYMAENNILDKTKNMEEMDTFIKIVAFNINLSLSKNFKLSKYRGFYNKVYHTLYNTHTMVEQHFLHAQ